jgi:antitoxin (DNA-binding transcriptional repressor) of toxin-antitoxin stability system
MTIHVNIGEAKTRLSELVEAALRGEQVVLQRSGVPVADLIARPEHVAERRRKIGQKRRENFGRHRGEFTEEQLTVPDERIDDYLEERFERKFGAPPA